MQKSVWGPATWKLLHTMVLKINNDASVSQINDLRNNGKIWQYYLGIRLGGCYYTMLRFN
jgi:hypothetical protein